MISLRDLLRHGVKPEPSAKTARLRTRRQERAALTPRPRMYNSVGASSRTNHSADSPVQSAMTAMPIDPDPGLRLRLFGPLRVYVGGRLVIDEQFTRRKAKALLALLYLERRRYITKDELVETLWPNLDE